MRLVLSGRVLWGHREINWGTKPLSPTPKEPKDVFSKQLGLGAGYVMLAWA